MTTRSSLATILAFDGLSCAGKSTWVALLHLLWEALNISSEVIRENTIDPHRMATARLNNLVRTMDIHRAVETLHDEPEHINSHDIAGLALSQTVLRNGLSVQAQKQLLLALMFAEGRREVDQVVRKRRTKVDFLILDRWVATSCAYQAHPDELETTHIMDLQKERGITLPDLQVFLSCPLAHIPLRRTYRIGKASDGTAGQMSGGREPAIAEALVNTASVFRDHGIPVLFIENPGVPSQSLDHAVRQAANNFIGTMVPFLQEYGALPSSINLPPADYWTSDKSLHRIRNLQTGKA